jgi:hypothetical protein
MALISGALVGSAAGGEVGAAVGAAQAANRATTSSKGKLLANRTLISSSLEE